MELTKTKILTRTMTNSRGIHLIYLINVNIADDVLHVLLITRKNANFKTQTLSLRN